MSNSNLMTHAGANLVSLADLQALPLPTSLGPQHNPVPHYMLADALKVEALERGYTINREQYALGMSGSALFGVMDLMPPGVVQVEDMGLSLGFRNSTNATLAIKVVAGKRVFVCDNLALSGDMIAVLRRNTKGLDLEEALRAGFNKFLQHASTMDLQIARMQARVILDMEAKAKIFDIFAQKVVPVHQFSEVNEHYFNPTEEMVDCHPRTMWGVHNAFTRALKGLVPTSAFNRNVALGRAFQLTAPADVIDV
jgi:hypothetical protein